VAGMRAVAELYAALLLLAIGAAVAGLLIPWIEAQMPKPAPPRPLRVVDINETHVVCYVPQGMYVNLTYWQHVGSFQCWLLPNLTSNVLQSCPPVLEPGTFILVTPPWLCR